MRRANRARTRGGRPDGIATGAFLFLPRVEGRRSCIGLRERLAAQEPRKAVRLEAENEYAFTRDDDGTEGRAARLPNVASLGVLDLDDAFAARVAEVGSERRGIEQQSVRARLAAGERNHHVRAGDAARMQPAVARTRVVQGQCVVVPGATPDQQRAPVRG